jgi:hypothetical protein
MKGIFKYTVSTTWRIASVNFRGRVAGLFSLTITTLLPQQTGEHVSMQKKVQYLGMIKV